LSRRGGLNYIREASSLFDSPCFRAVIREFKRGVSPSFQNLPLPLTKGKGIKGIGLKIL